MKCFQKNQRQLDEEESLTETTTKAKVGKDAVEKVTQEEFENRCHCGKTVATAKGLKIHQTKMKCLQDNQRQFDKEESLTETTSGVKMGDASVEKVTQEVLENSCHCGKKVATAKGLKIHQTKMKCLQKNQRHIDKEESLTETITGAKLGAASIEKVRQEELENMCQCGKKVATAKGLKIHQTKMKCLLKKERQLDEEETETTTGVKMRKAAVEKVTQEELKNICHCGKVLPTAKGLKIHQTKMKCLQNNQRQLDEEESLTETITEVKIEFNNIPSENSMAKNTNCLEEDMPTVSNTDDLPKNCDETTDSEASRCGKEARINPTSEYGMDSVNKFTCTENYSKVEQAFIEEIVETSVITTETLTYDQGPVDLLARPECEPSEPQLEYKPVDHLFSLAETSCDEYTDRNQASNTNTGTIHRRGPAVATEHTDPSLQHNLHEPTICILNLLRQCPSADNYITCGKLHRDQMYIWEIYIETKWQRFDSGNALESAYGDPQNEHLKFEKYHIDFTSMLAEEDGAFFKIRRLSTESTVLDNKAIGEYQLYTTRWIWYAKFHEWVEFGDQKHSYMRRAPDSSILETEYLIQKSMSWKFEAADSCDFLIDFNAMTLTYREPTHHKQKIRKVRRRPAREISEEELRNYRIYALQ